MSRRFRFLVLTSQIPWSKNVWVIFVTKILKGDIKWKKIRIFFLDPTHDLPPKSWDSMAHNEILDYFAFLLQYFHFLGQLGMFFNNIHPKSYRHFSNIYYYSAALHLV